MMSNASSDDSDVDAGAHESRLIHPHPESETSSDDIYHPLFSSPEANIILRSQDGTSFRIHSHTLRITSGWFRDMLSLPQDGTPSSSEVIYTDEYASTLEPLLRMICGLPLPPLDNDDIVESLLFAAEKYDMPGPLSIIRACVLPKPLVDDPLKLYGLACRYGWEEEIQEAATRTLALDIHAPEHRTALRKLTTDALLSLLELHHKRRHLLRKMLNEPPFLSETGPCTQCHEAVSYGTWRELKFVIDREMEKRPLGDTILDEGLKNWPSARACWNAKCPACHCALYDKKHTVNGISNCIDKLPKTISDLQTRSDALPVAGVSTA